MGLRAALDGKRYRRTGGWPGGALCASAVLVSSLALLLAVSPVTAQRTATSAAVVQIPPVSELYVESTVGVPATASEPGAGVFRIRVRANHAWKVTLGASVGAGEGVWIRATGTDGSGEYVRLEPGMETVVGTGGQGEAVLEVEYRVESGAAPTVAALPLTYTLASL